MPHRNKAKHGQIIRHTPRRTPGARDRRPAERDVQVPQTPLVEGAVPAAPELHNAVVIAHAAHHVLGRVDAVEEGPEAEEAPRDQQFEPDVFEVEEAEHAELRGGVGGPGGLRVEDGDHVHVVDYYLHG